MSSYGKPVGSTLIELPWDVEETKKSARELIRSAIDEAKPKITQALQTAVTVAAPQVVDGAITAIKTVTPYVMPAEWVPMSNAALDTCGPAMTATSRESCGPQIEPCVQVSSESAKKVLQAASDNCINAFYHLHNRVSVVYNDVSDQIGC